MKKISHSLKFIFCGIVAYSSLTFANSPNYPGPGDVGHVVGSILCNLSGLCQKNQNSTSTQTSQQPAQKTPWIDISIYFNNWICSHIETQVIASSIHKNMKSISQGGTNFNIENYSFSNLTSNPKCKSIRHVSQKLSIQKIGLHKLTQKNCILVNIESMYFKDQEYSSQKELVFTQLINDVVCNFEDKGYKDTINYLTFAQGSVVGLFPEVWIKEDFIWNKEFN